MPFPQIPNGAESLIKTPTSLAEQRKKNDEEQWEQKDEERPDEQFEQNNKENPEEELTEEQIEEIIQDQVALTPRSHLEAEMLRDAWRINQEEEQRMAENREKIEKEKGKEVLLQ